EYFMIFCKRRDFQLLCMETDQFIHRIHKAAPAFPWRNASYRVFRKRSCFLTTPNTCSTFARTEDFARSAFFAAYCPLLLSFFICDGRRLILYLIFRPALFRTTASSRLPAPR